MGLEYYDQDGARQHGFDNRAPHRYTCATQVTGSYQGIMVPAKVVKTSGFKIE